MNDHHTAEIYDRLGSIESEIRGVRQRLDGINGRLEKHDEWIEAHDNRERYQAGLAEGRRQRPKTAWDYLTHVWEAVQTPAYIVAMLVALRQLGAF